ncbi:thioesterase II family protein [Streptomyces sp. DSM 40907]|uniref:thioesterase II family protein n=1 Tax=Streptomyces kutzneri TaxID=3051179 RepID=UPI0028D7BE15|nr:alpha/beta fold hydrolase [Streptomyces sp. DSM 40907]
MRRFHPAPDAQFRLVCFPHAGGSATFYFPVAQALAPGLDVLAVQYPGRQDRRAEKCLDDIYELADQVTEALLPWTDRPLALFGHSMGATVAYEVARNLERQGVAPLGLFASGRRAPSCRRDEYVHQRDDEGLVAALKELSGTDAAVLGDEELLRMVLPAVRGDYKAVETYRHREGARLGCPVTVLVGDSDPVTSLEEAATWAEHTTGPCEVEVFADGGHFYLNSQAAEVLKVVERSVMTWAPVH